MEIRRYALSSQLDWLEAKPDWAGLQAVGRVESTRIIGNQSSTEYRYFLCSFPDHDRFATVVRGHWGIENQLHWVLDVQFGEDTCRTRNDHSAENLALIHRVAMNMLYHNSPLRDSIRRRKLRAALNDDYRLHLLFGQPSAATTWHDCPGALSAATATAAPQDQQPGCPDRPVPAFAELPWRGWCRPIRHRYSPASTVRPGAVRSVDSVVPD